MKEKKRLMLILIGLIVFIGMIPRITELLSGNYLFEFDQGLFFERVREMVVNRKLRLIGEEVGGSGGFFQGPGWYYLLSIPFIIFRGDPYGAMILMALIGLGVILSGAYVSKQMFGWKGAGIIAFLLAVSPSLIAQSRFIWNPFPVSLISVWILFSLYKVFKKEDKMLIPLFFFIGLLFHFEFASGIVMLAEILFITSLLLWKRFIPFRSFLKGLAVFLLTQVNFIIFDIRHDFIITKGILHTFGGNYPHAITLEYIRHIFLNHLIVFLSSFSSSFPDVAYLWPIMILIIVFCSAKLVVDKKVARHDKLFLAYLLASPFIHFLIYIQYLWPMWEWWILELKIVYIFLIGMLLWYIWDKGKIFQTAVFLLLISFFVIFIQDTHRIYSNDFYDYGGTHKIQGKIEALDTIYRDARGEEFGLLVFTPPVYTYPYDYLLWWHGLRKYDYLPHKEKKGLFYLLIEPDSSKPWSYKGWLETVVKTGEVLETKELSSGFIIQKRYEENQ